MYDDPVTIKIIFLDYQTGDILKVINSNPPETPAITNHLSFLSEDDGCTTHFYISSAVSGTNGPWLVFNKNIYQTNLKASSTY